MQPVSCHALVSIFCLQAAAALPAVTWLYCARYFNDVWEYDTEEHKWECRSAAAATGPSGRGGCQLALHGTALFVIGGHTAWREGKEEKEKVHDDVWTLDLHTWQVLLQGIRCHFVM